MNIAALEGPSFPGIVWERSPVSMVLNADMRVAACREALAKGVGGLKTQRRLAEALFESNRFEEGVAFVLAQDRAAGADPGWDMAVIHLLLGAGRVEEGVAWAEAALAANPLHGGLLRERAELLVRLGRAAEAEIALRAMLERCNAKLTPRMTKFMSNHWNATEFLALLNGSPHRFLPGDAPYRRVRCLQDLGRFDEAAEWMDVDHLLHSEMLPPPGGDLAAFNADLLAEVTAGGAFSTDPFDTTTRGGLQGMLPLSGAVHAPRLLAAVRGAVDRYAARLNPHHPFAAAMPNSAMLKSWMVRLFPGGRQAPHIHPSGWLSGVYYVAVAEDEAVAGGLMIPTGRDPCWPVRTVIPKPGALNLFPSYFKHHTLPHGGDGMRVCIAFDVVPLSVG